MTAKKKTWMAGSSPAMTTGRNEEMKVRLGLCVALLGAALIASAARADVASFYAGRSITLVVGAGAGGGYDSWARFLARHLGRHIPGQPTVVVQNFTGAGGLRAALHIYNVAPKDGSVIGLVQATALVAPLLGTKEAQFDSERFSWIGNMSKEYSLCSSWYESKIKTVRDLFDKEFIVGGTGAGTSMETYPNVLNNVLGTRIKIVSGYNGGSDVYLAMERGEVDGRCGAALSTYKVVRPQWLAQHKLNFLLQTSLDRDPELPGVPWIMDYAKSDEQRHILQLILAPRLIVRPVFAPPGIPEDRLAALRAAFDAAMADPEARKDAAITKLELIPMSAAETAAFVTRLYETPEPVRAAAADAMNRRDRTKVEFKAGAKPAKGKAKEEE